MKQLISCFINVIPSNSTPYFIYTPYRHYSRWVWHQRRYYVNKQYDINSPRFSFATFTEKKGLS